MNAELLLEHFDRIAEAPEAVSRLRGFILDLAVRGKLVDQSPEDEPARELLRVITGTDTDGKSDNEFVMTFPLPKGWSIACMASIASKMGAGSTPTGGKAIYQREGIPFIRSQNVHNDGLKLDDVARIPESIHHKMLGTHVEEADVLLNITGASIGRCALVPPDLGEANVSQHVAIIRLIDPRIRGFIHMALTAPFYQDMIMNVQVGVSREGLSMKRLREFPMVIPPLAEQHRIVAKVNELMAVCDDLEARQQAREAHQDRLVMAVSQGLVDDAEDPEIMASRIQFYLAHFSELTVRREHVDQLRQTILGLAVRGKLVRQDAAEESGAHLVARIRESVGSRLVTEKRDGPFEIPFNWTWATLPELGTLGRGKSKHRPRNDPSLFQNGTHPFIQTGDVARSKGYITIHSKKYNEKGLAQSFMWPQGTLCITIAANIADTGILGFDACFPDSVVGFVPRLPFPSVRYFEFFIRTIKAQLLKFAPATAQKNINLTILSDVVIPVPPVAEQHRIVSKVDELMSLCDELEERIQREADYAKHLMEAVLSHVDSVALEA